MPLSNLPQKEIIWPFILADAGAWLATGFALRWLGPYEKAVPLALRRLAGCLAFPVAIAGAMVCMGLYRRGALAPAALVLFASTTVFLWFQMQLFRGYGRSSRN